AYLMDSGTKTPIYAYEAEKQLPIASMCKIMTLILSFESIASGDLTLEEEICVSPRAASMGGSQVFLEANGKYPVKELIKSIVVCSANDSCVAMAEKIAGSESIFVDKMNEKAKQIGADNTLFANCTGLPKDPQYSCAKDVALMLNALTEYEEYFRFGKIWTDKFAHPEGRFTEISNTNRLVRFYDGCDGGKTGFTNQAGFCLAATAKRDNMRVISVVIGEESSDKRFNDVRAMFDYAFANYQVKPIVKAGQTLENQITVVGGKKQSIGVEIEQSSYIFTKRGDKVEYSTETNLLEKVKAPVAKGDKIGEIIIYKNNVECDKVNLLASEDCPSATFIDNWRKVANRWTIR
ncbi:MAG: D-alanyl-D-alanine carboxypeptidase, partial [Clostridia bacterium]|nr:D-alanyl-D-alanine carboxypeptidase [Clostridia bacterium]